MVKITQTKRPKGSDSLSITLTREATRLTGWKPGDRVMWLPSKNNEELILRRVETADNILQTIQDAEKKQTEQIRQRMLSRINDDY
jgi:bifunctional DNA-binding transcriptional regulator/antitoxin component of YhaV-PrlF toxin-antitoxin module